MNVLAKIAMMDEVFNIPFQLVVVIRIVAMVLVEVAILVLVMEDRRL